MIAGACGPVCPSLATQEEGSLLTYRYETAMLGDFLYIYDIMIYYILYIMVRTSHRIFKLSIYSS